MTEPIRTLTRVTRFWILINIWIWLVPIRQVPLELHSIHLLASQWQSDIFQKLLLTFGPCEHGAQGVLYVGIVQQKKDALHHVLQRHLWCPQLIQQIKTHFSLVITPVNVWVVDLSLAVHSGRRRGVAVRKVELKIEFPAMVRSVVRRHGDAHGLQVQVLSIRQFLQARLAIWEATDAPRQVPVVLQKYGFVAGHFERTYVELHWVRPVWVAIYCNCAYAPRHSKLPKKVHPLRLLVLWSFITLALLLHNAQWPLR